MLGRMPIFEAKAHFWVKLCGAVKIPPLLSHIKLRHLLEINHNFEYIPRVNCAAYEQHTSCELYGKIIFKWKIGAKLLSNSLMP